MKNVINSYTTQYKKEQKKANLPNGIKFMLEYVNNNFDEIEDKTHKIHSSHIKDMYKIYCERMGNRYQFNAFNTQIKKIGIKSPTQLNIMCADDISRKRFCYRLNTHVLQEDMRVFMKDPDYLIFNLIDIENVHENDIIGFT